MSIDLNKIQVIFMGTPNFSVPILNGLIANTKVLGIVTQPDKKVGRKQVVSQSPIKKNALTNNIEVLQPLSLKGNAEFIQRLTKLNSDLIIIAAYGFILPKGILEIPKYGVINVHASLLPKYRGPSPIQAAILNDDKVTGVSIMLVNEKMDEGDILSQAKTDIAENEIFTTLHDKLAILGAHLLIDTLPKYLNKEIKPQKQDNKKATYCKLITKDDGKINWLTTAQQIGRQIRAFDPWPGTWTTWEAKKLKIIKAQIIAEEKYHSGEVFKSQKGFAIKCSQDALQILELQLEGKNKMTIQQFLNGYPQIIGTQLS